MKFVTNVIGTMIIYVAGGADGVNGMNAGYKRCDEKIGAAMDKKLNKER